MKNIIFVNSHPIQYFAPMYKYMNDNGVKTKAWYCSDASVKGGVDKQFGVKIKWDIPLLEGYEYIFFKNQSWKPSHFNGFFGLINLGMIKKMFSIPKSVIVVHGWHYCTLLMILLLGKLKGHTICLRCDVPQCQEDLKKGWQQKLKYFGFRFIVFPRVDYFLYVGTQNKLFYEKHGVRSSRLLACPYAVDNERFRNENRMLLSGKIKFKEKLGILPDDKVIMFSGKYIEKKRPLDLLQAFAQLNLTNCWLIFVGEGELRKEMEVFISNHKLKNVVLTGFINQSQISQYYSISDVFVMCSAIGENWGLSVNEAMNFNVPLVLSDLTGCSSDLVKDGVNGYVFKTSDVGELTNRLRDILISNKLSWIESSEKVIDHYSYATVLENIKTIV